MYRSSKIAQKLPPPPLETRCLEIASPLKWVVIWELQLPAVPSFFWRRWSEWFANIKCRSVPVCMSGWYCIGSFVVFSLGAIQPKLASSSTKTSELLRRRSRTSLCSRRTRQSTSLLQVHRITQFIVINCGVRCAEDNLSFCYWNNDEHSYSASGCPYKPLTQSVVWVCLLIISRWSDDSCWWRQLNGSSVTTCSNVRICIQNDWSLSPIYIVTQLNSTGRRVELSCVVINGALIVRAV